MKHTKLETWSPREWSLIGLTGIPGFAALGGSLYVFFEPSPLLGSYRVATRHGIRLTAESIEVFGAVRRSYAWEELESIDAEYYSIHPELPERLRYVVTFRDGSWFGIRGEDLGANAVAASLKLKRFTTTATWDPNSRDSQLPCAASMDEKTYETFAARLESTGLPAGEVEALRAAADVRSDARVGVLCAITLGDELRAAELARGARDDAARAIIDMAAGWTNVDIAWHLLFRIAEARSELPPAIDSALTAKHS